MKTKKDSQITNHKSQIKDQTKIESFISLPELRMRERELKREWTEVGQVTDSALAECLTVSKDRGREHRESERRVSDGESER